MLKVIFHLDQLKLWDKALGNIKNLIKASSEPLDVILMANGDAVLYYLKTQEQSLTYYSLQNEGVKFKACRNSLNAQQLSEADLIDLEIVPAAVLELSLQQSLGFAYIKV